MLLSHLCTRFWSRMCLNTHGLNHQTLNRFQKQTLKLITRIPNTTMAYSALSIWGYYDKTCSKLYKKRYISNYNKCTLLLVFKHTYLNSNCSSLFRWQWQQTDRLCAGHLWLFPWKEQREGGWPPQILQWQILPELWGFGTRGEPNRWVGTPVNRPLTHTHARSTTLKNITEKKALRWVRAKYNCK